MQSLEYSSVFIFLLRLRKSSSLDFINARGFGIFPLKKLESANPLAIQTIYFLNWTSNLCSEQGFYYHQYPTANLEIFVFLIGRYSTQTAEISESLCLQPLGHFSFSKATGAGPFAAQK